MATRTRAFGAGNRESHDASDFYARFHEPELSDDDTVNPCSAADTIVCGDARDMKAVEDASVALVVTSPPYFAGKEYEQALGEGHIPGTYVEFLAMLRDVFAECKRVLEPGGRIAVNVANLGRKPYRSLSGDVMRILEDDLRLLPRGEIIWQKAKGATGSIAVGSYLSASNPVVRDVTERVLVASKGRFDRAPSRKERHPRVPLHEPHRARVRVRQDRLGPVAPRDPREARGDERERLVPARPSKGGVALRPGADERMQEPVGRVDRALVPVHLRAQRATIGRVIHIAFIALFWVYHNLEPTPAAPEAPAPAVTRTARPTSTSTRRPHASGQSNGQTERRAGTTPQSSSHRRRAASRPPLRDNAGTPGIRKARRALAPDAQRRRSATRSRPRSCWPPASSPIMRQPASRLTKQARYSSGLRTCCSGT